jgi:ABC-type multidrug transport system ATPase subunit
MMNKVMFLIDLKDISLEFEDKFVFRDFSLRIPTGEKVWIKAPSGSGKTTLLRLITGFVRPQRGQIRLFGEVLDERNIAALRSRISYAGQDAAMPDIPVREIFSNIYAYAGNQSLCFDERAYFGYARLLKLDDAVFDKNFASLSAGEKQRVGFVIARMLDRPLFLLDEITSNLDADAKEACAQMVASLDKTVVLISHDTVFEKYSFREVRL